MQHAFRQEVMGRHKGICEWVKDNCDRYPTMTAVKWGAREVTYSGLNAASTNIQRCLDLHGIESRAVVVVLMEDRIALAAAILALFESNRVLVALDPAFPQEALHAIVADVQPDTILTESALKPLAAALQRVTPGMSVLVVDEGEANPAPRPSTPLVRKRKLPPEAAYICYTSGSTGKPKGVIGRLEALAHFIEWEINTLEIGPGWCVSQFSSPGFDPLFRDLFVPLCTGGTSCAPPHPVRHMSGDDLVKWMFDQHINLVHTVPTLAFALTGAHSPPQTLPELRYMLLAGEALRGSLLKQWVKRFGAGTRFINLYGTTETTMVKLWHRVTKNDHQRLVVPIGKPISRAEVLLKDGTGTACTSGEVGEIFIRSPDLALGYYQNPEETKAVFLSEPGSGSSRALVYRTGDLGRELPDGSIEFLGRADDQVKIRGVRVELHAVQAALEGYPQIQQAEVLCSRDSQGENQLIAYVVLKGSEHLMLSDVRVFMRAKLLPEWVPSLIIPLDVFPVTPNNKVDRAALPVPNRTDAQDSKLSARNETEHMLTVLWCELLGLDSVGVHEDFLALGGHSLTATQMANRIVTHTGCPISIVEVFNHPTIAELASMIDGMEPPEASPEPAPAGAGLTHPALETGVAPDGIQTRFGCPTEKSVHCGKQPCCLVIVVNEQFGQASFERLAEEVTRWDPTIDVTVVADASDTMGGNPARPTLTFGPAAIRHRGRFRGAILCGSPLSKSEEYSALAQKTVPVPTWELVTKTDSPDLSRFGPYVVTKPNHGGRGAEVQLRRRDRVRWKPIFTAAAGMSPEIIVQEYIHTGQRPVSFRVTTLFGRVLYAVRVESGALDHPLPSPRQLLAGQRPQGMTIVSNAVGSTLAFSNDLDIIELAELAHSAFPEIPLLGVDIIRDVATSQLYVLEVNAIGYNWNFAGSGHRSWDYPLETQFDGLRKAAWLLAEQTQLRAC